jgi:teichuronic acid biosynthesis glycosyltransferase TuaC
VIAAPRVAIAVLTSNFPSRQRPGQGAFVERISSVWASGGVGVRVIAPAKLKPATIREMRDGDLEWGFPVHRPSWLTLGARNLFGMRLSMLSYRTFASAVRRSAAGEPRPDVWYGHFLFPAGHAAATLKRERGGKAIVCLGESNIERYRAEVGDLVIRQTARSLDGVVALSDRNEAFARTVMRVPEDRILRSTNAVDQDRFYPMSQQKARAELGIDDETGDILIFVGHFDARKGIDQVDRVVDDIPGLTGVFLGSGPADLRCRRLLFAGSVPPRDVCTWLNAANVFCLPSASEGSCNAIHEACATGLPVVVSRIPANTEFAGLPGVQLVDREDFSEIRDAVVAALRSYPDSRPALVRAARERLAVWNEQIRAKAMLDWIEGLAPTRADVEEAP